MNIMEDFWGTKYGTCVTLTDEMVSLSESRLGVKLPQLLIELLKIQNGGYTQGYGYKMSEPTSWAEHHIPFNEMFGLDPKRVPNGFNILDTESLIEKGIIEKGLILLSGDGHCFIALDYRKGENPTVRWIDLATKQDIHVSNSFEDFISNLITDDEIAELEG